MPQRHAVTTLDVIPDGTGKAFLVAGRKIAIFNAGGRYFAIGDECPHVGASLAEGTLDGTIVACPWHFAEFDVTCGKVLSSPASEDVPSFPVFVNGNSIEVEL